MTNRRTDQVMAGAATAVPQRALRVLLAEDMPDHQHLIAYLLGRRGHRVDIAGDGQQAIRMAQENSYDAILMDVKMPGTDGLEATKAIRAREKNKGNRRVPIIALTAYAMRGDRERCLANGMDGYLSKPINGRDMIGLVESLAASTACAMASRGTSASHV